MRLSIWLNPNGDHLPLFYVVFRLIIKYTLGVQFRNKKNCLYYAKHGWCCCLHRFKW